MDNKTNWWMVVAIVSLTLLLFSSFGMRGFGGFGCGSYRDGYSYSGGMMSWMFGNGSNYVFAPFMILGMLIAWGVVIVILIYFIKMINGSLKQSQNQNGRRKRQ